MLQENERVSSDRLFRVRSKQPYTSEPSQPTQNLNCKTPVVTKTISLGDICVFTFKKNWKIGKILQFAKCKALGGKYSESYTSKTTDISMKHVGVLCSYYEQTSKSERQFKLTQKIKCQA